MAGKSSSSAGEELVNHYGLIRLRVDGIANTNLRMTLMSLDELQTNVLNPLVLSLTSSIEPTVLCNFTQQRAKLQITTTGLGETFQISKIIIYVKPVANSYPQ